MTKEIKERELRVLKNEKKNMWEILDTIRKSNIKIMGIPESEEREKGTKILLEEIINEKIPQAYGENWS